MPKLHHEDDTSPTTTSSTGHTRTTNTPHDETAPTSASPLHSERVGGNNDREDGDSNTERSTPVEQRVQPSFLFRALSQAANSLWFSYFRPPAPLAITDSPSSSQERCYSPESSRNRRDRDSDDGAEDTSISQQGPMVPSAVLYTVLNGHEIQPPGESSGRGILLQETSNGSDDGDVDGFSVQIHAINAARAELERSLSAGVARHAIVSRDIERATRALTVRRLELDNRSLELDTRESECSLRESRLGIDWVARTRRICERERAAQATAAELAARFSALETRQAQQDEILKAERDHFWDIQRALSQVISNETDELLEEQRKLRQDFAAKSAAARNALAKMHTAVRLSASAILKDGKQLQGNSANGNGIPKYLREMALETRRQFENATGYAAPNGWSSLDANGAVGQPTNGIPSEGATVPSNGIASHQGERRVMGLKRVNPGVVRPEGSSQSGNDSNGNSLVGLTSRIGGSDRTEPG